MFAGTSQKWQSSFSTVCRLRFRVTSTLNRNPESPRSLLNPHNCPEHAIPNAYDGDIVLNGVILDQFGERHERVLALGLLRITQRAKRADRSGLRLHGERVDLVGQLRSHCGAPRTHQVNGVASTERKDGPHLVQRVHGARGIVRVCEHQELHFAAIRFGFLIGFFQNRIRDNVTR